MRDTTVTVQRNKTTIRTGLAVNTQNMSWREADEGGSGHPYDSYWIRTTGGGIVDVRRGDLLIDENEIDPMTSQRTQYRVFAKPRQHYETELEMQAEQIVGT